MKTPHVFIREADDPRSPHLLIVLEETHVHSAYFGKLFYPSKDHILEALGRRDFTKMKTLDLSDGEVSQTGSVITFYTRTGKRWRLKCRDEKAAASMFADMATCPVVMNSGTRDPTLQEKWARARYFGFVVLTTIFAVALPYMAAHPPSPDNTAYARVAGAVLHALGFTITLVLMLILLALVTLGSWIQYIDKTPVRYLRITTSAANTPSPSVTTKSEAASAQAPQPIHESVVVGEIKKDEVLAIAKALLTMHVSGRT